MILSYKKDCNISYSKGIQQQGDLSSSTECISGIFDWNGASKPNKMGDDVMSLNGGSLVFCTDIMDGKYCVRDFGKNYSDFSPACDGTKGISEFCDHKSEGFDRWFGAQKICEENGLTLSTVEQLLEIAKNAEGQEGVPKSGWYWSSANSATKATIVTFDGRYSGTDGRSANDNVLCIGK